MESFSYTPYTGFFLCRELSCISRADFFWGAGGGGGGSFSYTSRVCFFFSFFLGSSSYSSRAGFIFIWGVSLTHPVLGLVLSTDLLLHIPCWFYIYRGSFSYTSRAGLIIYLGCFSYTSHAGFIFMQGVSYTSNADSFYVGSFSYTSRAVFIFMLGVSLTHPVLVFLFISCVSLTHPMLALFLSGEFFLHIPCWIYFSVGSFSYTSLAGFILCGEFLLYFVFMWGVSLTHRMLTLFLFGEFFLHIPCWLYFSLGSFSDTSHDGFFF